MAEFTAAEYAAYVKKYPDLVAAKPAGMSDSEWGKFHYETHGEKNMRPSPGVVAGNDEDTLSKPDAAGFTPREYRDYVQKYPDLVAAKPAGMSDAEWGKQHYEAHGEEEGRLTPTRAKTSVWWDQTTGATGEELGGLTGYSDDQYLNYVLANPDLRELSEALGLTQSETIKMGQQHWGTFGTDVGGQGENRAIGILNAAEYISNNSDFSAGSQAASEAYVQRITQNAPGSQMWDARTDISPDWRLNQFTGAGWNMAADQPYQTGILGDTLEVNTGIGQLVPTSAGDPLFLQDRYVDASIANDFPVGWTTADNTWSTAAGVPQQLGNYWDVLTNAVREDGILRRVDPYDPTTAVGPSVSPGPRGGGNVRSDGTLIDSNNTTTGSGAAGSVDLLAYRPWTKNYWNEYIPPKSQGLLYMNEPQRDYGLAYLPGEHRDPVVWGQWADDHKGHIPGGGWRFTPESYTTQTGSRAGKPAPWHFTSGAPSATNIYANPWNATSMNLTPAQGVGWQGFLSGLGATPAIDTTTATLLGV
jgi:hypothetical protein